jgi:hypothetical protein
VFHTGLAALFCDFRGDAFAATYFVRVDMLPDESTLMRDVLKLTFGGRETDREPDGKTSSSRGG